LKSKLFLWLGLGLLPLPAIALTFAEKQINADDVVAGLISVDHWTPFYWGQARFGSLVPFLALPIKNLTMNLLFQNWMHLFFLLIFLNFLTFRMRNRKNHLYLFVAIALVFYFFLSWWPREYTGAQPYGDSFGLSAIALICFQKKYKMVFFRSISVIAFALANWVNPLTTLYILPLLLIPRNRKIGLFRSIPPALTSAVFGILFLIYGVTHGEIHGFSPPSLVEFNQVHDYLPLIFLQICTMIMIVLNRRYGPRRVEALESAFFTSFLAWPLILLVSTSNHIKQSDYATRYFIPFVSIGFAIVIFEVFNVVEKYFKIVHQLTIVKHLDFLLIISLITLNIFLFDSVKNTIPLQKTFIDSEQEALSKLANPEFAIGEYWYAWPIKLFVSDPINFPVFTHRMEDQRIFQKKHSRDLDSLLAKGATGVCFGKISICEQDWNSYITLSDLNFETKYALKFTPMFRSKDIETHYVKISRSLSPHQCWLGSDLPTEFGQNSFGSKISESRRGGFLTYGPYIGLEAGNYVADIDYKILAGDSFSEVGYIDRASEGRQIPGSAILIKGSSTTSRTISFKFNLAKYSRRYEIRFNSNGSHQLSIDKLCLTRK